VPIKGISDVRRLPRRGKIRLGVRDTSARTGTEYPKAVDYFVVKEDASTPAESAEAFRSVYGEEPRALDVMLPVHDRETVFPQYLYRYGAGAGLLCKGDGQVATELDRDTGELREIDCDPSECAWANTEPKQCRPVGSLQVLLHRVPGLGVWQLDTSSYHSIVAINSALDFLAGVTAGKIAMIPLKLILQPKEVQVTIKSNRTRKKTIYVVDLVCAQLNLSDLVRVAQKAQTGYLLDAPDMQRAPDDLYPRAVTDGQTPPAGEGEASEADEEDDPSTDLALDRLDRELEAAFNDLEFDQAEREQWRKRYGRNRQGLLHHLRKLGEGA